jgi:hypothetical protein
MSLDLNDYNARWLQAWTNKDVPGLLTFYAEDIRYFDPGMPKGAIGHAELGAYLTGLFGATPPMTYTPEEIWPTHNGFCGRWYCTIGPDPKVPPAMRGFDLVVLKGDRIVHNEVYVHELIPGILSAAA